MRRSEEAPQDFPRLEDATVSKDAPNEALLSTLSAPITKPVEASSEVSKPVRPRTKFHPLLRDLTLILPLCFMLTGLAAQTAAFGYYRGVLAMKRANAIQVVHFAIIPIAVVAVLYPTHSVALILSVSGGLTVIAAALFARPIFREIRRSPLPNLRPYATALLR